MEKIFFALGHEKVENRIKELLDNEGFQYEIVYTAVHKESVISEIPSKKPSILILREGLPGKADVDVFQLAASIRSTFPEIRIIFLAANHELGDPNIANLVGYSIYDILVGAVIQVPELVRLIIHPNSFEDVAKFLPTKKKLFDHTSFGDISDDINKPKSELSSQSETIININAPISPEKEVVKDTEEIEIETVSIKPAEESPEKEEKKFKLPIEIHKMPFGKNKKNLEEISPQRDKEPEKEPDTDTPYIEEQDYSEEIEEPVSYQKPVKNTKGLFTMNLGDNRMVSAKQKMVTFFSPKGGIGTTVVALNAAMEAAKRANQRVLFIEFNTIFSSTAYWFMLPNEGYGLEDALIGIGTDYNAINTSIITKERILKSASNYTDGIKRIPNTLDFLVFSDGFYKRNVKPNISASNLEKLITYCLYTLNYDEVYLDLAASSSKELIDSCLISSGKNVILFSQDVAIINNVVMFFYDLNRKGLKFDIGLSDSEKKGPGISYKNIYVVNKTANSTFTQPKIKAWIGCKNICSVPENGGEINELLSAGYIPLSATKSKQFRESFKCLVNFIEQ